MNDLICIKIGGFFFVLKSKIPIVFFSDQPSYQSFLIKSEWQDTNQMINIRLELGNIPDTRKFEKIFTSGQSWSMFQGEDSFWLARDPRSYKNPLWIARFDKQISEEVVVYCGDDLISEKQGKPVVYNPFCYPLDQILVMYVLSLNQGAIFHAAGVNINGNGLIFPGPSGAGKSTISRQFKGQKGMEIFSDDRMIIRKIKNTFFTYGTPWPGEEGIALNENIPLSGIIFLRHGLTNQIKEVQQTEALKKFLKVISIPWYDREVLSQMLDFCEEVVNSVPVYELQFTPTPEVVSFLNNFLASR
jgi:hypothetical protein